MDDAQDTNNDVETPLEPEISTSGNSQIWTTIIVSLAMLVVGVLLGYFGRGAFGPEASATRGTATSAAAAVQTRSASNQDAMNMVISETRHWKGDANAPVTLIEFSDFQ
jgi:hypothetical protein